MRKPYVRTQTRGRMRMRTNSPGTSNEWHSFLLPFEANDAAVLVRMRGSAHARVSRSYPAREERGSQQ